MSWIQKLYDTYENCQSQIGSSPDSLLPIYHTTQLAQIEAWIDSDGNWCSGRSKVLTDKKEMTTVIPCFERSSYVANGRLPHPLFDKLQYIAKDYAVFADDKKSEYDKYISQLSDWCCSPFSHPSVCAVLKYLKKGRLISDLIEDGILFCGDEQKLLRKWDGDAEKTPPIFKGTGEQADAFVRFQVIPADGSETTACRIWEDESVWQSFINYQNSLSSDVEYCYVLGEKIPPSTFSPKKIRNTGDSAKLISANDSSGFTYRGRFLTPREAFCVSREASEKAHNALKWLITKQGYHNGDQVIVSFATNGKKLPSLCADSFELADDFAQMYDDITSTNEEFADRFKKAIAGYGCNLEGGEEAIIMGLDSATAGRLSVFYYREMQARDLLGRIENWHKSCSWLHTYRFVKEADTDKAKETRRPSPFVGAPSPSDIAQAAYGKSLSDKQKKSTVERILPCIADGAPLPLDIVRSAAMQASNPTNKENWEINKNLSITCALIKKYYNDRANKEVWQMAVDETNCNRDYLFGRVLAYMNHIESLALYHMDESGRRTNAQRLQMAFHQHPAKLCDIIHGKIQPYLDRLPNGTYLDAELNEVISKIKIEDFNNKPLSEIYLLGYASQMQKFKEK